MQCLKFHEARLIVPPKDMSESIDSRISRVKKIFYHIFLPMKIYAGFKCTGRRKIDDVYESNKKNGNEIFRSFKKSLRKNREDFFVSHF